MSEKNSNFNTLSLLSESILKLNQPMIMKASDDVCDLLKKQEGVVYQLLKQRELIDHASKRTLFGEMAEQTKVYHNKLVCIQKKIDDLKERSLKIKRRAVKIQQQKQQEALSKEQAKEWELEREKQLVARPASRKS